jgi:hypothetical protein
MKYLWWVIIPIIAIGLSGCWDFDEDGWARWSKNEKPNANSNGHSNASSTHILISFSRLRSQKLEVRGQKLEVRD